MTHELKFREATHADLNEILTIFVDCIQITAAKDYAESQRRVWSSSAQTPQKWLNRIDQQSFWLALEENTVVGFASLENGNYLDCMYVAPKAQGKGIAQLLLDKMEALARKKGTTHLISDVSHTARGFFEKNRYQIMHPNEITKDGVTLVNFHVKKAL